MSELSSSQARIWLSEKESCFSVDVEKSFLQEKCSEIHISSKKHQNGKEKLKKSKLKDQTRGIQKRKKLKR